MGHRVGSHDIIGLDRNLQTQVLRGDHSNCPIFHLVSYSQVCMLSWMREHQKSID